MHYETLRREYATSALMRENLDACPLRQFERWMEEAVSAGLDDPTAMVLATLDEHGAPWQRIVLLKGVSDAGFVFYTNHGSDKAQAIVRAPRVSLLFPWNALNRQVIVAGSALRISSAEAAAYFATRPRDSQVAAWASRQSQPIADRAALQAQAARVRETFGDGEIPMPDFWGGYRVAPQRIEFWQGREHRLHDRFVYTREAHDPWRIEQLQP